MARNRKDLQTAESEAALLPLDGVPHRPLARKQRYQPFALASGEAPESLACAIPTALETVRVILKIRRAELDHLPFFCVRPETFFLVESCGSVNLDYSSHKQYPFTLCKSTLSTN